MKRLMIYLIFALGITMLPAQSLFESALDSNATVTEKDTKLNLNGFTRGSVFGGGETYDLASTFAEFALQTQFENKNTYFKTDIRFRKGIFFNESDQLIQLKELYVGYCSDKLDVLLGNQIVNWGRTDGFNPTNNITPTDYFFLSANPDDQKESNFMLRVKYRFIPSIELELIGIPFYQSSNYRYDLFELGENVSFIEDVLPSKKLKNGTFACRFNFDLPAVGWSVSYFRGSDPYHGFDVKSVDWTTGSPIVTNASTSYLKSTFGIDFAVPAGNWIIRGEAAYNVTENPDNKMYIPLSDLGYVMGIETNLSGFTLIGQYVGKFTPDFVGLSTPVLPNSNDPLALLQYASSQIDYSNRLFNRRIFYQQEKMNHAVAFSLSKMFGYDAWNAELATYYDFTSDEWLVRPKLTWKISDALSAAIGVNYMSGPDQTLFSYSASVLNGMFLELKVSF